LGRGITISPLESANDTQLLYRLHAVLPTLWGRSSASYRCALMRTSGGSLRRRRRTNYTRRRP
jgi:hypothetical protein